MLSSLPWRRTALAMLSLCIASSAGAARWVPLSPADTTRPISRATHCAVLDEPGRRIVVWGERIPTGEIWTLPLDGPAVWSRIATEGVPPPRRAIASAIFDPVRRRMLIFGGGPGEGSFPTGNDVWALTLDGTPRWEELHPAGELPKPRDLHCAIYDPVRDRMLVFGGYASDNPPYGSYENSVWELTLGGTPTWRALTPSGVPPSPRIGASMVYDPVRDRALVFGGNNPTDQAYMTYRNDVFELTLGEAPAWRLLAPRGAPPSPRYSQVAVMDAERNQMLVFGGCGYNRILAADTWTLDLAVVPPAWRRAGPDVPIARAGSVALLDPDTDRLIVDGGDVGGPRLAETIALPLAAPSAWKVLSDGPLPSAPARRIRPVPLVDPLKRVLLVEGGRDPTTAGVYDTFVGYGSPTDLWSWSLDSRSPRWELVSSSQVPFRGPGRAVLDPERRLQVRFFQDQLDPLHTSSVGVMPLDPPGTWTALAVPGTNPEFRQEFSTALDPVRHRILLTGGYTVDPHGYSYYFHRDIWALSLAGAPAWTLLREDIPGGPQIYEDSFFFDPQGDQFVAVGYGDGHLGTWTLASDGGSPWRFVAVLQEPYGTVSFDPQARELITLDLYHGEAEAWHHVLSDTAGWGPVEVAGEAPRGRMYSRVEMDPATRRILCFGGQATGVGFDPLGDLWALELDRASASVLLPGPDRVRVTWTTNVPGGKELAVERRLAGEGWAVRATLTADAAGSARYEDDAVRPGLVADYRLRLNGTVLAGSEQHLTVVQRPPLALAGAWPNPAIGSPRFVFTLPGASPARLAVYDVSGRVVASRDVGSLGAGEHELGIERRLAPGLYVAVLSQSGQRLTRRFVVAR